MLRSRLSSLETGGRAAVLMEPEGREGNAAKPALKSQSKWVYITPFLLYTLFSFFFLNHK